MVSETSDSDDSVGDWSTIGSNTYSSDEWAEEPGTAANALPFYSEQDCISALRGERVPESLDQCPWMTHLCVLRGIRYRHGFGTELRNAGYPELTRALDARDIMSNIVPEMVTSDDFPYCIWHPAVASEAAYRALWRRYPDMSYHVGRACAVAGYAGLYRELGLLPDVSIAEEARDNRQRNDGGSQEIFDHIMSQPVKWRVMDDYTRSVNTNNPSPARFGLNGDTAVYSSLELKRAIDTPRGSSRFRDGVHRQTSYGCDHPTPYFNITEDWCIDEYNSVSEDRPLPNSPEMTALLWNPLPDDLPEGNKDILILMAAYYGNVDRYARLRRPSFKLICEDNCVVRGIYHNTMFAKWASLQPEDYDERGLYGRAINARFIMSNDVSRITEHTPHYDIPYMIWYPAYATAETYIEVARRRPEMMDAVARACLVANYQDAWDSLDLEPSHTLFAEAKISPNPHYLADLRQRCAKQGLQDVEEWKPGAHSFLYQYTADKLKEEAETFLLPFLPVGNVEFDTFGTGIYDGFQAQCTVDLFACAPEELRPSAEKFAFLDVRQLYHEMCHPPPPGGSSESLAYHRRRGSSRRGRGRGGGSGVVWGNDRGKPISDVRDRVDLVESVSPGAQE